MSLLLTLLASPAAAASPYTLESPYSLESPLAPADAAVPAATVHRPHREFEWVVGFFGGASFCSWSPGGSVESGLDVRVETKWGFPETSVGWTGGAVDGAWLRVGWSWWLPSHGARSYLGLRGGPQFLFARSMVEGTPSAGDFAASPLGGGVQGGIVLGRGKDMHLDLRATVDFDVVLGDEVGPFGVRGGLVAAIGW